MHQQHPNKALNSPQHTMMGHGLLDSIFGMFVTHETVKPNPNRNKFSIKSPSVNEKTNKQNQMNEHFQGIGLIFHTGIFLNVNGAVSVSSGTIESLPFK